uniref:Uncharacterized protein n=1 Tax=Faecalibaculum rodentium TaxID=1702221 RepID=A0A140DSQ6_9FIRM|nr:hypothetical protein AALO17_05490 [Faecalibaculum rodentium]
MVNCKNVFFFTHFFLLKTGFCSVITPGCSSVGAHRCTARCFCPRAIRLDSVLSR